MTTETQKDPGILRRKLQDVLNAEFLESQGFELKGVRTRRRMVSILHEAVFCESLDTVEEYVRVRRRINIFNPSNARELMAEAETRLKKGQITTVSELVRVGEVYAVTFIESSFVQGASGRSRALIVEILNFFGINFNPSQSEREFAAGLHEMWRKMRFEQYR